MNTTEKKHDESCLLLQIEYIANWHMHINYIFI